MRCIFCDIIAGKSPASIVYQDDTCIAFLDVMPINPGHLLIVPQAHATTLADLPADTAAHMMQTALRLATALRRSGVRCEGINLQMTDGELAGQTVPHMHLHVIPRFEDDGFGLRFAPSYPTMAAREELDTIAGAVKHAMG